MNHASLCFKFEPAFLSGTQAGKVENLIKLQGYKSISTFTLSLTLKIN